MIAQEMIDRMRMRLRDEEGEGWSDAELLDSINLSLSAIAVKLMPWKNRWHTMAFEGVDTYSIPEDFVAPISVIVGGVMMPIRGIEYALGYDMPDQPCVFIDNDSLILYPIPDHSMDIIVNYHAVFKVKTPDDLLKIPDEISDTVLFYALSLAHQKEAHEASMAQSKYYLQLYKDRCVDSSKASRMRRSGTRTQSRFIKV